MWNEPFWMAPSFSNHGEYRDKAVSLMRKAWGAKGADTATFGLEIPGRLIVDIIICIQYQNKLISNFQK